MDKNFDVSTKHRSNIDKLPLIKKLPYVPPTLVMLNLESETFGSIHNLKETDCGGGFAS